VRTVAIIGGGPAGAGCALTMLREARERGRQLAVMLFEPKQFGRHHNQCAGVVVQEDTQRLLAQCGVQFPQGLVQRTVSGYVLHARDQQIALQPDEGGTLSVALRRVELDTHLLAEAASAGAEVLPDRVTDLEFGTRNVTIYTEGPTHRVDAVVGAFGLDAGAAQILSRRTGYRPPPCIDTLVTKIHPGGLEPIAGLLEDQIHAFLPRLPPIEFGALIPKGNHLSAIIAGVGVGIGDMEAFLQVPQVAELLPAGVPPGDCFRGAFPLGLARRFCGPRHLIAGDAAGLVRPFKGGGINAALTTGRLAGLSLLDHGVGPGAALAYLAACRELRSDVWYGRQLRRMVSLLSGPLRMEPIIDLARRNPAMQRILHDCVSGRTTYRQIAHEQLSLRLLAQAGWACLTWPLRSR